MESQFDENMELICKECVTRIPFIMHYENSENLEKIMDPLENNDMENKKESSCKLETLKDSSTERKPHSIYIAGLREKLCRCEKCLVSLKMLITNISEKIYFSEFANKIFICLLQ